MPWSAPRAAGRRTLASATVEVDAARPLGDGARLAPGFGPLVRLGAARRRRLRARLPRAAPARSSPAATDRFADVERDCTELIRDAELSGAGRAGRRRRARSGRAGSPSIPHGGSSSHWSSLPPALMVMPELSLVRADGRCFLTVNALVEGGEGAERALDGAGRRLASLSDRPIGPLDPNPVAGARISAPYPPGRYEELVANATSAIRAGEHEKVVLGPRGRRHRAVRPRPGSRLRRAARRRSHPASASPAARPRPSSSAPAPSS